MQSPREDMRKTLEKAVIIESAKTDSGFKSHFVSKEAYKTVSIRNDLFYCIRGLNDPHNQCEKEYRYSLHEIDKVLDFMFLEKELEEKNPKLADFFGKEQLEKEANVKMLNLFLEYIESEFEEVSKSRAETNGSANDYSSHHLHTGRCSTYNNLREYLINAKKKL